MAEMSKLKSEVKKSRKKRKGLAVSPRELAQGVPDSSKNWKGKNYRQTYNK